MFPYFVFTHFKIIPCLQGKRTAAKQIFSSARHGMSRLCLRTVEFAAEAADRRCKRLTNGQVRGYYTINKISEQVAEPL